MFYDLERPADFARDVTSCLAADGVWHFEQSYMPSMLRTTGYDTICHEHLEYYSLGTIKRILDEAKLEILDVRFNRVNGGSFAITASHKGTALPRQDVLVDWLPTRSSAWRSIRQRRSEISKHRVFQHRADLVDLVRRLRGSGAIVWGYGASTKGNVVLQFCGFTSDDITAIGEVNEDKFGRVTPGTEIPIVPEAELRAAHPDYTIVFPWHFREAIIDRESDYLESGRQADLPAS